MDASASGLRALLEQSLEDYKSAQTLDNHLKLTSSLQQYITFQSAKR